MKRRTAVLVGAVVVLVVAAGGIYAWHRLATGGKVTEVGVAEAIDRYREQIDTTTTGPPATTAAPTTEVQAITATMPRPRPRSTPSRPPRSRRCISLAAPGVYQYATTGLDSVDALDGCAARLSEPHHHHRRAVRLRRPVAVGCRGGTLG